MQLIDLYPTKGMYKPGEPVRVTIELEGGGDKPARLMGTVHHLEEILKVLDQPIDLPPGKQSIKLEWLPPLEAPRGYGLEVRIVDKQGAALDWGATAFDVQEQWIDFPRYGFLCDFPAGRMDIDETIAALVRYHLNGLQFYDWGYRHDALLPPRDDYLDPLGRPLSLDTVRRFLNAARQYGMACMPYLAVYAASLEFWRAHPEWALYNRDGIPAVFAGFLGLMDPSPGGLWIDHLLEECKRLANTLPFDGFHVDQYGEPKEGYSVSGEPVDLPRAFQGFICQLKKRHPGSAVTFNAVKNWPIEALAAAPQDFLYIEVWPDTPEYADLQRIVAQARSLSGGKPVVVALYQPTDWVENVRLTDAVLHASGATRIEVGEKDRLLSDPYFPKHQPISPELALHIRRAADFTVRYGEWTGPPAHIRMDISVHAPLGIIPIVRQYRNWVIVNLINFTGLPEYRWDQQHPAPLVQEDVEIELDLPSDAIHAWWVSPDRGSLRLKPARFYHGQGNVRVSLPHLDYWTILAIELEGYDTPSDTQRPSTKVYR